MVEFLSGMPCVPSKLEAFSVGFIDCFTPKAALLLYCKSMIMVLPLYNSVLFLNSHSWLICCYLLFAKSDLIELKPVINTPHIQYLLYHHTDFTVWLQTISCVLDVACILQNQYILNVTTWVIH